ncbi:MAG: hypothetical protein AMXMBFR64_47530 [Myxococcales bacterium]
MFLASLVVATAAQLLLVEFLREQATGGGLGPAVPAPKEMTVELAELAAVKPPEPPDPLDGQVVDLPEPPEPVKPPEEAKFLNKVDTRTEKETKAPPSPKSKQSKAGKARVKEPSQVQSERATSPDPTQSPDAQQEMELPEPRDPSKPTEVGERSSDEQKDPGKERRLLLPGTSRENALANLQALAGETRSDDALMDVEEGSETSLNSRKFRYWDFFNRVKDRVREHWHPQDVYRRRDPHGRVYGVQDRLTVLTVTLDDRGALQRMVTVKDSGADFLDEEARRAFQAASPFPNPPVGLLDPSGQITFQFGFLFEISTGRQRWFWKRL